MHRSEYMVPFESEAHMQELHERYYAQYVHEKVTNLVLGYIGKQRILDSKDPHFNDIPLKLWDNMVYKLPYHVRQQLKANGDSLTLGTGVCILKAAARAIRDKG